MRFQFISIIIILLFMVSCGSGVGFEPDVAGISQENTEETGEKVIANKPGKIARFSSTNLYNSSSENYKMNGASFESFSYSYDVLESLIVADALIVLNEKGVR